MINSNLKESTFMEKWGIFFIYCAGVYSLSLAVFHILFWKIPMFNWKEELDKLSPVNKGVMQVLNLCLVVLFILIGFICFIHTGELLNTSLGRTLLAGLSMFWLLRFICQFVFWKNNMLIFYVIFISGFLFFLFPLLLQ